jgi:hypothetical protein
MMNDQNKRMLIRLVLLLGFILLLGAGRTLDAPPLEAAAPMESEALLGVTTIVVSDTAPAGSFGVERVLCPDGMTAVGGGVDLENVFTMKVSSSAPVFPSDDAQGERLFARPDGTNPAPIGWQATAVNEAATAQGFKVAVICAPLSGVSAMVSSDTAPAGSFGVERSLCPDGMTAVGGGVDLENVFTMQISSSAPVFPSGDPEGERLISRPDGTNPAPIGWQASGVNDDATDKTVKVAAICASLSDVSAMVLSDTAPAGSFGVERSLCPDGMTAVGGGVDLENVLTMQVSSSAPTFPSDDSQGERLISRTDGTNPAPIGWQASGVNDDANVKEVKVAAICTPLAYGVFLPLITE